MLNQLIIQRSFYKKRKRGSGENRVGLSVYSAFDDLDKEKNKGWVGGQQAIPTDMIVTNERSRLTGNSLRVEVNSDASYNGSYRTEIRNRIDNGWDHWFGFSIFFPTLASGLYDTDPLYDVVWQLHATSDTEPILDGEGVQIGIDKEPGRSPTVSLRVENDALFMRVYGVSVAFTNNDYVGYIQTKLDLGEKIRRGEWNDFVVFYSLRDHATVAEHGRAIANGKYEGEEGVVMCWLNRQLAVNYRGISCYNDLWPPYHKLGVYKPAWKKCKWVDGVFYNQDDTINPVSKRVLFYDEYRQGNEHSEYKDVDVQGRAPLPGMVATYDGNGYPVDRSGTVTLRLLLATGPNNITNLTEEASWGASTGVVTENGENVTVALTDASGETVTVTAQYEGETYTKTLTLKTVVA